MMIHRRCSAILINGKGNGEGSGEGYCWGNDFLHRWRPMWEQRKEERRVKEKRQEKHQDQTRSFTPLLRAGFVMQRLPCTTAGREEAPSCSCQSPAATGHGHPREVTQKKRSLHFPLCRAEEPCPPTLSETAFHSPTHPSFTFQILPRLNHLAAKPKGHPLTSQFFCYS